MRLFTTSDDEDDDGRHGKTVLRLLAQRECRGLCVKLDSTGAVAVAIAVAVAGARRAVRGADRQGGTWKLRPGCKSPKSS